MKKIILPGLLAGLVMLIVAMILSYIFGTIWPSIATEYANTDIFRAWEDWRMTYLFLAYYFVLGIILAWVWSKIKQMFKGACCQRAFYFGLSVWLVLAIPGMWMSYSSFQLSLGIIVSWLVMNLVNCVVAGAIFAKLNK
ncbi:MAG: hypothetical protein ABIH67_05600 [Candidatus Uhrbacteria bacterium]